MQSYTTEAQEFKKSWGKVWWSVLIQGIITFGFGMYSLFNPGQSSDALISLFGILLVVNGIVGLFAAITQKEEGKNSVSGSAITIIFGGLFIALAEPISTFVFGTFLYIIAAILMLSGIIGLFAALKQRVWTGVFGALFSILIALTLFTYTSESTAVMMFVFGAILVLVGLGSIILAFVLRAMGNKVIPTLDDTAIVGESEIIPDEADLIEGEIVE